MGNEEKQISSDGLWAVRTLCGSNGKAPEVTQSAFTVGPMMIMSGLWVAHCEIFSPHAEALDDGQLEVEKLNIILFPNELTFSTR